MHADESVQVFAKIFVQVGAKWKSFIKALKNAANPDNQSLIFFTNFLKVARKFGASLNKEQQEQLLQSFPGQDNVSANGPQLNIARIFDQEYQNTLAQMYKNIDVAITNAKDEPTDVHGFHGLGTFYREKVMKMEPITEAEFIDVFVRDNKVAEVMLMIRSIDQSHNGYITRTELDDIIKHHLKEQMNFKDLNSIIAKFCSMANPILIDYKKFQTWLLLSIKKAEAASVNPVDKLDRARKLSTDIQKLQSTIKRHELKENAINQQINEITGRSRRSTSGSVYAADQASGFVPS